MFLSWMPGGNMQSAGPKSGGNTLTSARRLSSIFSVGLTILLLIFFGIHQKDHTGFFTSKFGSPEMVALYLPILISLMAPIMRIAMGTLDPARLVEAFSDLCLGAGSLWLRLTFPFDFTHIAEVFPPTIQVGFGWLNDNVGRFILLLQIIIAFISAFATVVSYLTEHGMIKLRSIEKESRDKTGNKV
jgi:energy-coupling factor transporter transmembrane protein EcfT